MASSKASHIKLSDDQDTDIKPYVLIHPVKQTAIDKTGGIFCHICNTIFGNKKVYDSHYAKHGTGTLKICYTCVICKKQFSGYPSFRGHCYLNHVVKNLFQCKYCPKSFSKLCILNSHISAVHDYKCKSCDKKFTSKKDLVSHNTISHTKIKKGKDAPPYECHLCSTVILTMDECKNHIDNHCEMRYPCPICKEVLPNKLAAAKHLTKHFNEKLPTISVTQTTNGEDSSVHILGGILCYHCDKLFHNRSDIDRHFAEEHDDKIVIYSCNVCNKSFDKYNLFGDHCYYHFSRDRFQCDQCNKTFRRLSLLVIHTEMFHTEGKAEKPFQCDQCEYGFRTSLRLKEHKRIVHEKEDCLHRCTKPDCTAAFGRPKDLIQHLKIHTPMLDNWCKQCGLQFTSLSSAEKHLEVHRHKQYSCPICAREYHEKYLMVKHIPVHFETVLHICKVCGKAYSARNRLIEHTKSHSDSRSFKCTYCSKSFVKPFALEQHLNTHTGQRPFTCTLCPNKTFANYPNWSKHLKRAHVMDKIEIKKLYEEWKVEPKTNANSPMKSESGIESAGSEVSDIYTFADSDDSADEASLQKKWKPYNVYDNIVMREIHAISNPATGESMSMTDTVNAVIDRIDSLNENLDVIDAKINMTPKYEINSEFNTSADDTSDIQAIVEDIDAMSKEMEAITQIETSSKVSGLAVVNPELLQYADMTPVDNALFNNIPDVIQSPVQELRPYHQPSSCLPEYGPDFTSESSGLTCDGLINLEDHVLPHIDPLLTIKSEDKAKKYVQNFNNYDFDNIFAPIQFGTQNDWTPPIITKVYQYEENNDANRIVY